MYFKIFSIIGILFVFAASSKAQQRKITYDVSLQTNLSSEKNLAFWQVSNQYGLVPNATDGIAYAGLFSDFAQKHAIDFAYGISAAGFVSDIQNKVILDEAYISAKWKFFRLDMGLIHNETEYNGLSSTNGNLILSNNARSIPGVNLHTDYFSFPFVNRFIAFKANWAEYWMNDKRFVDNTMMHTKSVYVKITPVKCLEIIAGFQHFAQWDGTSRDPKIGPQPDGIKNYFKMFFGKSGGDDASRNDQLNLLGNHLGRQHYKISYLHKDFILSAYLDRPFEDKSGLQMRAFPDGLWGIYYGNKKNQKAWFTDLIYECSYTKYQCGPYHDLPDPDNTSGRDPNDPWYGHIMLGGNDNYFNNGIYQSGWTYHGNTLGSPFLTPYAPDEDGITHGIRNNRVVAHYLGMMGYFLHKIPYTFRASYSMNYGLYSNPLPDKPRQVSLGLEAGIPPVKKLPFRIDLGLYGDFGELFPNNVGFTLKISRKDVLTVLKNK